MSGSTLVELKLMLQNKRFRVISFKLVKIKNFDTKHMVGIGSMRCAYL